PAADSSVASVGVRRELGTGTPGHHERRAQSRPAGRPAARRAECVQHPHRGERAGNPLLRGRPARSLSAMPQPGDATDPLGIDPAAVPLGHGRMRVPVAAELGTAGYHIQAGVAVSARAGLAGSLLWELPFWLGLFFWSLYPSLSTPWFEIGTIPVSSKDLLAIGLTAFYVFYAVVSAPVPRGSGGQAEWV